MDEARYREAEGRVWASIGLTPTEHRVRLQRNDVSVRVQDVGEGPAVLFVHGAITCGTSWAPLVAHLRGFRCLLLDRPGSGLSDTPPKPLDAGGLSRLADTLVSDVLDGLGLDAAHVVGTSFGGYLTLRSAAAEPQRILRMVQFSWPVGASRLSMRAMLPIMLPMAGRMLVRRHERAARGLFRAIGHGPSLQAGRISQPDIDCFVALLRHTHTMRNEITGGGRLPRRDITPNRLLFSEATLAKVQTPTYFLWGENDVFGGPDVGRRLVERMPNAELEVMPGAGHAPWLDDAGHAAKATSAFLTK